MGTFRDRCGHFGAIGAIVPLVQRIRYIPSFEPGPLQRLAHGRWRMYNKTRLRQTMTASCGTAPSQAVCTARERRAQTVDCFLPSQQRAWREALPPALAALSHGPLFRIAIAARHDASDFATRQEHKARRAFFRAWVDDCARRQTNAPEVRNSGSCLEIAKRRRGKVIR